MSHRTLADFLHAEPVQHRIEHRNRRQHSKRGALEAARGPAHPLYAIDATGRNTGQRFTTHASSLSALSSLPRELLEPVVAVDDVLVLVVDVDGVVS